MIFRANAGLVVTSMGLAAAYTTLKATWRSNRLEDADAQILWLEKQCKVAALDMQRRSARRGEIDTTDALTHAWGIRNRADVMAQEVRAALQTPGVTPERARQSALESVRAYVEAVT